MSGINYPNILLYYEVIFKSPKNFPNKYGQNIILPIIISEQCKIHTDTLCLHFCNPEPRAYSIVQPSLTASVVSQPSATNRNCILETFEFSECFKSLAKDSGKFYTLYCRRKLEGYNMRCFSTARSLFGVCDKADGKPGCISTCMVAIKAPTTVNLCCLNLQKAH